MADSDISRLRPRDHAECCQVSQGLGHSWCSWFLLGQLGDLVSLGKPSVYDAGVSASGRGGIYDIDMLLKRQNVLRGKRMSCLFMRKLLTDSQTTAQQRFCQSPQKTSTSRRQQQIRIGPIAKRCHRPRLLQRTIPEHPYVSSANLHGSGGSLLATPTPRR